MTKSFRWSEEQIRRATARRAIPTYTKEEEQIRQDLMMLGTQYALSTRRGGRARTKSRFLASIRRDILLPEVFRELPEPRQKTPNGDATVECICDVLAKKYGFNVSHDTVRRDIKKFGAKNLRQLALSSVID